MRPYWTRLLVGMVLGCLCGLTASMFIWATRTLVERLAAPDSTHICPSCGTEFSDAESKKTKATKPKVASFPELEARFKQWQRAVNKAVDPWLPRVGLDFNWKRMI